MKAMRIVKHNRLKNKRSLHQEDSACFKLYLLPLKGFYTESKA